jgi:uncharacterized protein YdhG (YjbR/CyaY superfamily)
MARMKAYASFAAYLAEQSPRNRTIIRALRRFVARVAPKLEEAVKYVQFGFFRGASLRGTAAIDERAFAALLKQAAGAKSS